MENQYEEIIGNGQNTNTIRNNNENEHKRVNNFRRILPQFLAGSAKNLLLFDLGAVLGYQTIIIGNLLNSTSQPSLTDDQSSWFASLMFIGQPVGSILAAIIMEPIGRKKSMVVLNIPLFIGWLFICLAQSVPVLYIGSVILGFGLGFMEAPTLTYIGEISESSVRGVMTTYAELSIGIGTVVVYTLGVVFNWRAVAYICTAIPVISVVAISLIPESPIWLLAHNRIEEAKKSLCWLRGWVQPQLIEEEFSQLISYKNSKISNNAGSLQSETNNGNFNQVDLSDENIEHIENKHGNFTSGNRSTTSTFSLQGEENITTFNVNSEVNNLTSRNQLQTSQDENSLWNIIYDLMEPKMLHALLLMNGFFFFNAACSANVLLAFAIPVFMEIGITMDPFVANVINAVSLVLGEVTLMIIVKYLGRRKIVLFSIISLAACSFVLGIYTLQPNMKSIGMWSTPFVIYIINNFVFGLGLATIPWMYLSEVFPFRGRGLASGLTASVNYIFGFIVTKSFFTIKGAFTLAGFFFFYGSISLIGVFYLYFLLPETEGKTLQDIEDEGGEIKIRKK